MKSVLLGLGFIFSMVLFSNQSSAQIRKIPASVTESFKDKYPTASNVEWRDKVSAFVAVFEDNDLRYESRFSTKGEWVSTERLIEDDQLAEVVKEGFEKSKYAEWTIEEVYKIELPNDVIQYRLHVVKTDLQKKNLLFNEKGRLLKDRLTL